MASVHPLGEMPGLVTVDGRQGWLIGDRFIPRMAGGSDDDPPKGDDPPKSDDPPGDDFDKERALATIRKLRENEKTGKATQKQLDDALARLKEIEDKDKSEVEKLAGTAKEASEKLTLAEARARDLAIRLSVERAARKLSFIDEDDAFRLIDHKAVEMDAEGTPTNIESLLTALAKAKPHLVGEANGNGKATKPVPGTPKPAGAPTRDDLVKEHEERLQKTGLFGRL